VLFESVYGFRLNGICCHELSYLNYVPCVLIFQYSLKSSTFINDFNSGIKYTLSKFADDTKLSGAVDTPKGQDAIQRDLDRLKKLTCVNLMRFNKAKGRVLHIGQGKPPCQYRLGVEEFESSPAEKDLGILVDEKLDLTQQCVLTAQKANYPGLHPQQRDHQVKRGDSAPLLHSGETPPGVLHPALESSAQETHGAVGEGPEEGHNNDQGAGTPLL